MCVITEYYCNFIYQLQLVQFSFAVYRGVQTSAQRHGDVKSTDLTLFLPEEKLTVHKQVNSSWLSPAKTNHYNIKL